MPLLNALLLKRSRRRNVVSTTARRYAAAGLLEVVRFTAQTHRVRERVVLAEARPGDGLIPPGRA